MKRLLILVMLSALALVSCDAESAPLPTLTPVPLADALTLENTYTAELVNATISLRYPDGWLAISEFADLGVVLSSSPELTGVSFDTVILPGQVYIDIVYAPKNLQVMADTTPELVLASLLTTFEGDDSTVTAEPIISTTMNDNLAAYSTLNSDDGGEGIQIVVDSGDAYSVLVAVFASNERMQFQNTVEAIAGSIEYTFTTTGNAEVTPEATAEIEVTTEATAEVTETSE